MRKEFFLLCLIIFISCQQNNKPINPTTTVKRANTEKTIAPIPIDETRQIEEMLLKKITYIESDFGGIEDNNVFTTDDEQSLLIIENLEKYIAAFCQNKISYIKKTIFPGTINWAIKESESDVSYDEALDVLTSALIESYQEPSFDLLETKFLIHDLNLILKNETFDIYI